MADLFNAHTELRRLLLGKVMPPFTPIQEFERMRRAKFRAGFNEDLSEACVLQGNAAGSAGTAAGNDPPSAASPSTQE